MSSYWPQAAAEHPTEQVLHPTLQDLEHHLYGISQYQIWQSYI